MSNEIIEINADDVVGKTEKEIRDMFSKVPAFFKKYVYRRLRTKASRLKLEIEELESLKNEIIDIEKELKHYKERKLFHANQAQSLNTHRIKLEKEAEALIQ